MSSWATFSSSLALQRGPIADILVCGGIIAEWAKKVYKNGNLSVGQNQRILGYISGVSLSTVVRTQYKPSGR